MKCTVSLMYMCGSDVIMVILNNVMKTLCFIIVLLGTSANCIPVFWRTSIFTLNSVAASYVTVPLTMQICTSRTESDK